MKDIICTLGTTTDDKSVLEEMIKSGMTCARMNTAYAEIEDYQRRLDVLRSIARIPILMDLKGPEPRLKSIKPYPIDSRTILHIGFNNEDISFNKNFYNDTSIDDDIYLENGTIHMKVKGKYNNGIQLQVLDPGEGAIINGMGVNVPGKYLNVEKLSKKDYEVIDFAISNKVEYLALSFVRDYEDINNLNYVIDRMCDMYEGSVKPMIIAKTENQDGIDNLDDILTNARVMGIDIGVMVARGDLGVELPMYKLPFAQVDIINTCKKHSTYVITATDLLENMQYGYLPTRSEVNDVYNALNLGSDALMLSGETSNSKNPIGAVQMMRSIMNEFYSTSSTCGPPYQSEII